MNRETLIDILIEIDEGDYEIRDGKEVEFFEHMMRHISAYRQGVALKPPRFSDKQEAWIMDIWDRARPGESEG